MIETELIDYLTADADIIALVGDRIYPLVAPKDTPLPYLVCTKVSGPRKYTHQGKSGLQRPRMQVSVYGERYFTSGSTPGVKDMAETVMAVIEAWPNAEGVKIAQIEDEKDLIDPDTKLPYIPIDFFVNYGS